MRTIMIVHRSAICSLRRNWRNSKPRLDPDRWHSRVILLSSTGFTSDNSPLLSSLSQHIRFLTWRNRKCFQQIQVHHRVWSEGMFSWCLRGSQFQLLQFTWSIAFRTISFAQSTFYDYHSSSFMESADSEKENIFKTFNLYFCVPLGKRIGTRSENNQWSLVVVSKRLMTLSRGLITIRYGQITTQANCDAFGWIDHYGYIRSDTLFLWSHFGLDSLTALD